MLAVANLPAAPLNDLQLVKGQTIRGYSLMEVTTDPARLERGKQFITEGLADARLKPIIARTFPVEQIVAAPAAAVYKFQDINLTAANEGLWGNRIWIKFGVSSDSTDSDENKTNHFKLQVLYGSAKTHFESGNAILRRLVLLRAR